MLLVLVLLWGLSVVSAYRAPDWISYLPNVKHVFHSRQIPEGFRGNGQLTGLHVCSSHKGYVEFSSYAPGRFRTGLLANSRFGEYTVSYSAHVIMSVDNNPIGGFGAECLVLSAREYSANSFGEPILGGLVLKRASSRWNLVFPTSDGEVVLQEGISAGFHGFGVAVNLKLQNREDRIKVFVDGQRISVPQEFYSSQLADTIGVYALDAVNGTDSCPVLRDYLYVGGAKLMHPSDEATSIESYCSSRITRVDIFKKALTDIEMVSRYADNWSRDKILGSCAPCGASCTIDISKYSLVPPAFAFQQYPCVPTPIRAPGFEMPPFSLPTPVPTVKPFQRQPASNPVAMPSVGMAPNPGPNPVSGAEEEKEEKEGNDGKGPGSSPMDGSLSPNGEMSGPEEGQSTMSDMETEESSDFAAVVVGIVVGCVVLGAVVGIVMFILAKRRQEQEHRTHSGDESSSIGSGGSHTSSPKNRSGMHYGSVSVERKKSESTSYFGGEMKVTKSVADDDGTYAVSPTIARRLTDGEEVDVVPDDGTYTTSPTMVQRLDDDDNDTAPSS